MQNPQDRQISLFSCKDTFRHVTKKMAATQKGAQGGGESLNHFLQLSQLPIVFDRISTTRGVFFDPYNNHVLCVHSNNTEVNVKGLNSRDNFLLNIPSKGQVKSIKFSGGNEKILSIQRRPNSVEFVTVFSSTVTEFSLPRKPGSSETGEILDFFWVFQNEMIVIVRKGGVDVYSFDVKKKDFKLSKTLAISIGWCLFSHQDEILLVRAKDSNHFQMFNFRRTSGTPLQRMAKFDVEMPTQSNAARSLLMACNVVVMKLYGVVYVAVNGSVQSRATEIVLYQPMPDGSAKPAHRLTIDFSPPITMSVVDNLVIVHHQVSKTSMMFDIGLEDRASQGGAIPHRPLICPLPLAPCFVPQTRNRSGGKSPVAQQQAGKPHPPIPVDLYSVSWLFFQPGTIIDIQLGLMWQLKLNLEAVKTMMIDKVKLTHFFFNRSEGQKPLLSICREGLESDTQLPFEVLSAIFNIICMEYQASTAEGAVDSSSQVRPFFISPSHLYNEVFMPYQHEHSKEGSMKVLIAALSEYIRALHKNGVKADNYIYELLISLLIETKNFYQLQQFIQYRVVEDSTDVACLLVSKELVYPAAAQLALDMYRRQPNTENDIIDIMFSKGEILQALRIVRSLGRENAVSARQFLEAAANEGDKMLFYAVYKFFEERNIRLRNQPSFPVDEQCQAYESLFKEWFPDN